MWIGTLALVGMPFFAGFYSKDTIIEAAAEHAHEAHDWIATYGYWAVLLGAFVTSFYSFRLLYMTFFGEARWQHADAHHGADHAQDDHAHDDDGHGHGHEPHESPWVVTLPLVLLAIPSVAVGFLTIGPMLFGTDMPGHAKQLPFFLGAIDVSAARDTVAMVGKEFHGPWRMALHGFGQWPFWLVVAGFALATLMYWWKPGLPAKLAAFGPMAIAKRILENKYGADDLWIKGFAGGGVLLGRFSRGVDEKLVDGVAVNGSARLVDLFAALLRRSQSGYLYHYAFAMILGLIAMLAVGIRFWQ
jgi:NADH-quinone oxidoreductase subunit L